MYPHTAVIAHHCRLERASYHETPQPPTARVTAFWGFSLPICLVCGLLWAMLHGAGLAHAQTSSASAASVATATTPLPRPRIGLVLSGGGARGFAHIGVLKALEKARVPVDMVVGTSMGAIIGGLYASGLDPEALETELMGIAWADLFTRRAPRQSLSQRRKEDDFELSPLLHIGFKDGEFRVPHGVVSSRSLEWLLRRYTLHTRHASTFDALPTPYRAIATDMETGEAVVLKEGDLAAALRASMSVPGVFAPLELDGRILGDGGLVNNLPVDVARDMGVDVVIAVNIGTPLAGRDTLNSVLGISTQMINILTEQNVQRSMAMLTPKDLLLIPPLGQYTSADFDKAPAIAEVGHAYAKTVQAALERFAISEADYAAWRLQRQPHPAPLPQALAFVRLEGVTEEQAGHLERLLDTQVGTKLDLPTLETDLQQLSAVGDFEHIDYHLQPEPNTAREGLVIRLKDGAFGAHQFRLGLDWHTDFAGDAGFNFRLNHKRLNLTSSGTELHTQLEIGSSMGLRTGLIHPWGSEREHFVSAYASTHQTRVQLYTPSGQAITQFNRHTTEAGIDRGGILGRGGSLGEWRLGGFISRRVTEPALMQENSAFDFHAARSTEWGLRGSLVLDRLDYANFPQNGYRLKLEASSGLRRNIDNTSALSITQGFRRAELEGTQVLAWGPHILNVYGRLARANHTSNQTTNHVWHEYALGGFHQLSGYKTGQVAGDYLAFLRLGYYRRLAFNPGLARALFIGGTVETGNAWRQSNDIDFKHLKTSYSLYIGADTGLGPIYFALVHGKGQSSGFYLFMGRP
jgi:NTE family protein